MSVVNLAPGLTQMNEVPVLIRASDADAQCRFVNPTWSAFTGRPADQDFGEGWTASVHPADREAVHAFWMTHFKRRRAFEVMYRLRRADGEYRWVLERSAPQRAEREFLGFLHAALDVHERREMETGREGIVRRYVNELRTPLQAARVLAELVRRDCAALDTTSPLTFRRIDQQFDRMSGLLDDLSQAMRIVPGPEREIDARPVSAPIPWDRSLAAGNSSSRGGTR